MIFFLFAIATYSYGSNTTPDNFGTFELLTAIFLVIHMLVNFKSVNKYILIFFLIGLASTLMMTIKLGASFSEQIRDIIPFGLIAVSPLAFRDKTGKYSAALISALIISGTILAIRYALTATRGSLLSGALYGNSDFLSADPIVMAATFLTVPVMFENIIKSNFLRYFLISCGLFCLLVSVASMLRGSLLLFAILYFISVIRYRRIFQMSVIFVLALYAMPFLLQILLPLLEKTVSHGVFTGKEIEVQALLNQMELSQLFLGAGFGSKFYNPVLNSNVRFVHFALFGFWFKFGVLGLTWYFTLIFVIFSLIIKCIKGENVSLTAALFFVVFYNLTYQSTYKSISFYFVLASALYLWRYIHKLRVDINAKP